METLITNGIKISVETFYHEGYSIPMEGKNFFAYRISIHNLNDFQVQLLRRHWFIEDSNGTKREVKGDGVIGKQPILDKNSSHVYVSGCPLETAIGRMSGYYTFLNKSNMTEFKVNVPIFIMQAPYKMN